MLVSLTVNVVGCVAVDRHLYCTVSERWSTGWLPSAPHTRPSCILYWMPFVIVDHVANPLVGRYSAKSYEVPPLTWHACVVGYWEAQTELLTGAHCGQQRRSMRHTQHDTDTLCEKSTLTNSDECTVRVLYAASVC